MLPRLFLFISFLFSFLFSFTLLAAQVGAGKNTPVIFDSDMGPDYDDVGAIALLHAFADQGKIKILATIASTKYEGVAAVFSVFNSYFGRPDIPIGVPVGKASELKDGQHWTDSVLANYPHKINFNNEVPDAIKVYRKALASQPDKSVIIITTGFLTNLANLISSLPDEISPLPGRALVRQKVRKLVAMAGRFPQGKEFNVHIDTDASKLVFEQWPTPILLSGFEIGMKVFTGLPIVNNQKIQNSPVKDVFRISIPLSTEDSAGRKSWDETAVLVAVEGYRKWYTLKKGRIVIAEDGSNIWDSKKNGHFHLVEKTPPKTVQDIIDKLIQHQPKKGF